MALFVCDFELLDHGDRVVVLPVGLDGATEGYDLNDAYLMAADWLKEIALDFLVRSEDWPNPPLGTDPVRGGRMVTVAVDVSLDRVPAMSAAEAALTLGVNAERVVQLCEDMLLESWEVDGIRMVSVDSVETRRAEELKADRSVLEDSASA